MTEGDGAAGAAEALAARIVDARITPVRLREGYDMGEVDAFLDELEKAVRDRRPTSPLVDAVRFTPVRLREGYDMREVDELLASVAADGDRLAGVAGSPAPDRPSGRPVDPPEHTPVVQEQRGLLSRLFGRS